MTLLVGLLSIVAASFLLLQTVPRLFPGAVGSSYFRKQLWINEVDWRKLPAACLRDFVTEALDYAKVARAQAGGESFLVEYQRMMRIHATVVAAVLTNATPDDIDTMERTKVESKIQTALSSGGRVMSVGREAVRKTFRAESMHTALLRSGLDPFDMDGQAQIAEDIRTGKTWDLQKAILRRHGILQAP